MVEACCRTPLSLTHPLSHSLIHPLTRSDSLTHRSLTHSLSLMHHSLVFANPCRKLEEQLGKQLEIADIHDICVDYESSRLCHMKNCIPCLTTSRCRSGSAMWLLGYGRRLTLAEMMRLQGIDPALACSTQVPNSHVGAMVGNAVTVTVVERLLRRLLVTCGFADVVHVQDVMGETSSSHSTVSPVVASSPGASAVPDHPVDRMNDIFGSLTGY
jgi:hypothetical protein